MASAGKLPAAHPPIGGYLCRRPGRLSTSWNKPSNAIIRSNSLNPPAWEGILGGAGARRLFAARNETRFPMDKRTRNAFSDGKTTDSTRIYLEGGYSNHWVFCSGARKFIWIEQFRLP